MENNKILNDFFALCSHKNKQTYILDYDLADYIGVPIQDITASVLCLDSFLRKGCTVSISDKEIKKFKLDRPDYSTDSYVPSGLSFLGVFFILQDFDTEVAVNLHGCLNTYIVENLHKSGVSIWDILKKVKGEKI